MNLIQMTNNTYNSEHAEYLGCWLLKYAQKVLYVQVNCVTV